MSDEPKIWSPGNEPADVPVAPVLRGFDEVTDFPSDPGWKPAETPGDFREYNAETGPITHNRFYRGPLSPTDLPSAMYEYVIPAESRKIVDEMAAMLERLQWDDESGCCVECYSASDYEPGVHAEGCSIAALLKRVRGE
jgi:hypothetical protein